MNQSTGSASDKSIAYDDDDVKFSMRVTDPDTLEFLDDQETVTTYKTMQVVDGKLYPPMAAVVAGNYEDASKLGAWEQATERPDLIKLDKKGKPQFTLNKGKGKGSLAAAYNPYMHSSNLVLNDQFSGAYDRPNLVTVECEVPVSELTSGYRAQYAKDSVGWHAWHTGTVAGALRRKTGIERQVLLSRWIKPVRIVPDSEVAQMYKDLLDGTGISVPDNVVSPSLLAELKKVGVDIAVSGRVPDDGVKYSPRFYDVEVSDSEIRDNIDDVLSMESVIVLKGDEVTFGDGNLQKTVLGYYNEIGGKAFNPAVGDVTLNNRSIKNSRGHGMYPLKAIAFYAVPTVVEEGKIINFDPNWQGSGQKSYIIAAPVSVSAGSLKGEYWMGVVVLSNADSQRFYTHDVIAIKKEGVEALKTGTNFEEIRFPGGNKPFFTTILQKLNSVKADARHQLRALDQISDRELLANVMDSAAETAAELDFVCRYRSKIDELNRSNSERSAGRMASMLIQFYNRNRISRIFRLFQPKCRNNAEVTYI